MRLTKLIFVCLWAACINSLFSLAAAAQVGGNPTNVLPSGAYSESIAIEIPAYRGLEPKISLSYNSNAGNGWLGVGWNLNGLSHIERAAPARGTPWYTGDDIFLLDGLELTPCSPTIDSPSCKYPDPTSAKYIYYTSRIESFNRIAFDATRTTGETWHVWTKDGTKMTYEPRRQNAGPLNIWDLVSVEDTLGNRITYSYWNDGNAQGVGETYLGSIVYNGNLIKFYYEIRPDVTSYPTGGDLVSVRYRLKAIDVQVGGARARVYSTSYVRRNTSGRSFLAEVRQYGRDAQLGTNGEVVNASAIASLPPVTISATPDTGDPWTPKEISDATWGLPIDSTPRLPVINGVSVPISLSFSPFRPANLGDVDGNGQTDWVLAAPDLVFDPTARHRQVLLSAALSGKRASIYVQTTLTWNYTGLIKNTYSADVNGDSRTDLLFLIMGESIPGDDPSWSGYYMHLAVALSLGDGTFAWATPHQQPTTWETRETTSNRVAGCRVGDVDGDARDDMVCSFTRGDGSHHVGTARSISDGRFEISELATPFADEGETRLMALGDTNGDGLSDPMFLDFPHCLLPSLPGCQVNYEIVTALSLGGGEYQFERHQTGWERGMPQFFAADVSGDGKADFVISKSVSALGADGAIQTAMRQTDGSYLFKEQPVPATLANALGIMSVGDANGDGKVDLLFVNRQPSGLAGCSPNIPGDHVNLHRVLSLGDGSFAFPPSWTSCANSKELNIPWPDDRFTPVQPEAGDLDGDGTADFIIATAQHQHQVFVTLYEDLSPAPMANVVDFMPLEANGDGKSDWVYMRNTHSGPCILAQLSDGATYKSYYRCSSPGTEAFTVVRNWKVMDVDADGLEDLVYLRYVTAANGIEIGVWFSQGDGTWRFALQQVLSGVTETYRNNLSWRPMDVNGDGKSDLVRLAAAGNQLTAHTLISNGDGTWNDKPPFSVSLSHPATDVVNWRPADVNGDGRADFVHVSYMDPGVYLHTLLSKGDGTWMAVGREAWRGSPDGEPLSDTAWWRLLDANGDGLTDLVHVTPANRRPGQTTSLRVHTLFSHGDGSWKAHVSGPIGGFTGDMVNWRVARVIGDERTELVHSRVVPPAVEISTLSQETDGDWRLSAPNANVASGTSDPNAAFFKVADSDGNGQDDLIRFELMPSGMRILVVAANYTPDLLTTITSSLGSVRTITYDSSSHSLINDRNNGCRLPGGVAFYAVSSVEDVDGRTSVVDRHRFSYACARWSHRQRGLLSWEQITATRAGSVNRPGSILITRFNTSDECLSWPTYTALHDAAGHVLRRVVIAPVSPGASPPYRCLVNYHHRVEANRATVGLNIFTYYAYDEFGNVRNVFEYGSNLVNGTDGRTTYIAYRPSVGPYIVGLPQQLTISEGVFPARKTYRIHYFCYDGDNGTASSSCPGTTAPISKGLLTATKLVNDNGWYDTTIYGYDSYGNLTTVTDALGRTTNYSYDPNYHIFPETTCNPAAQCSKQEWDKVLGRLNTSTEINGRRTEVSHDSFGRPILTRLPDGGVLEHEYHDWGDAKRQRIRLVAEDKTSDGLWAETYIDGLGRPYLHQREGESPGQTFAQQVIYSDATPLMHKQSHWYEAGTKTKLVFEDFEYDELGRPARLVHPDGSAMAWTYYNDSQSAWTAFKDELGHGRSIYNDAFGRVSRVQEAYSGQILDTVYQYNPVNELISVRDAAGNTSGYRWDLRGHNRLQVGPDRGTWNYDYDRLGNLQRQTDSMGQSMRFNYDALNRLQTMQYPSNREVIRIYDDPSHGASQGQVTAVTDTSASGCPIDPSRGGYTTEELFYDAQGRVSTWRQCIEGRTFELGFSYDILGRLESITYPDGETVTNTYNAAGQLRSVSGYADHLSYNAAGRLTRIDFANGVQQDLTYDPLREWLKSIQVNANNTNLFQVTYHYEPNGLVKASSSLTHAENFTYGYDELNRLEDVQDVAGGYHLSLTYDAIGNVASNSQIGQYRYTYTGSASGCGTTTANLIACPHAVKEIGSAIFRYDANGNLLSISGDSTKGIKKLSIEWNLDDEPDMFSGADGIITYMKYDADGQRVARSRDNETTLYFFEGLFEVSYGLGGSNLEMTKYYYADSRLLARSNDTGTYWYHLDRLGSPRRLTDQSGAPVAHLDYLPWGTTLGATSGTVSTALQFTGHRTDSNSDLIYMNARYYHPLIGRFVSPDPIIPDLFNPQALNRYSYSFNNPIMLVDPSGLQPVEAHDTVDPYDYKGWYDVTLGDLPGFYEAGKFLSFVDENVRVISWAIGNDLSRIHTALMDFKHASIRSGYVTPTDWEMVGFLTSIYPPLAAESSVPRLGAALNVAATGLRSQLTASRAAGLARLGPAGASVRSVGGAPGAMVKQLSNNACGMACGQQLLRESGVEVFQSNLTHQFYRGHTPESLAMNLNRFLPGWTGFMTYPTAENVIGLASRGSFIARLGGNPGHFVIVDGVKSGMVLIRDPVGGVSRVMGMLEFLDIASGVVFR